MRDKLGKSTLGRQTSQQTRHVTRIEIDAKRTNKKTQEDAERGNIETEEDRHTWEI